MLSWLLVTSLANGATVNVDPSSSIQTLTSALTPGTEVVFADGTYTFTGILDWTGVGTADQPIVLRAADGAHPVLQTSDGWIVARLRDSAFVTIRGLTFSGTPDLLAGDSTFGGFYVSNVTEVSITDCVFTNIGGTAVGFDGNNTHVAFERNEISHTDAGSGLDIGCGDASCWMQDSRIANNWIHDLGGEYGYGMLFDAGTQNVEIADNVVYNMAFRGIQVESTEYGEPNQVHGNVVWAIGSDGDDVGIGVYGAAVVQNNVVFNITGRGMRIGQDGDRPFEHVAVSFNTIVNTSDWGLDLSSWGGRDGMVLANNVVANPVTRALRVQSPADGGVDAANYLSGNILTGYVEGLDPLLYPTAFTPGSGYSAFVDVAAWNFYPAVGSELIDSGDPSGEAFVPADDFNGMPRDGGDPDVGAFEVWQTDNPGWVISEGFKTLTDGEIDPIEVGGCCNKDKSAPEEGLVLVPVLAYALRARRLRRS